MSLNWREIELVLSELKLEEARIQNVVQVDFTSLYLEFYQTGRISWLLVCLRPGLTRLHLSTPPPRTKGLAPRFCEFLKSRIHGFKVASITQYGRERIVVIHLEDPDSGTKIALSIRLWCNAANIIATDGQNTILDAFYRRPQKSEISGKTLILPALPDDDQMAISERFLVRDWPGSGTFNAFLDTQYQHYETEQEFETLHAELERASLVALTRFEIRSRKLSSQLHQGAQYERLKQMGDMILSASHTIRRGESWIEAEDWQNPGQILRIQLDPRLEPFQNAERYFQRYQKARDGERYIRNDLAQSEKSRADLGSLRNLLSATRGSAPDVSSLRAIAQQITPYLETERNQKTSTDSERPGLSYESNGFLLLIGRSAQENDVLLRRYVRGNDYWLHVRDMSGSYVFIKVPRTKSVPLEVLLDAAHLAVWYSKAKGNLEVDLFYTQVKYLRRAKHGTLGTVVPTQEKNLHIRIDPTRVENLQGVLKRGL